MKIYSFIIVLFLFINVNSQKFCNKSIYPEKSEDCYKINLSEEEIRNGTKYCCYVVIDDKISCEGLNQEEYEEIGMNVLIAEANSFDYEIDCNSFYLHLGLINLLYFLFLFLN